MWNVIAVNPVLQKRHRQKQYLKHRRTLSNVRPQIDNLPPPQYDFLTTRLKAKQQAHQKYMAVQADNQDLVRRMIRPRSSHKNKKKQSQNSLHSTYLKHMAEKIQQDNTKLVNRLQGIAPSVNFSNLEHDHKKHLKWRQSHKRASGLSTIRPLSAR